MEDMSCEIIDAIKQYDDGTEDSKELIKQCLFFLYHVRESQNNNKLLELISDWFEENHYCIDCGTKLIEYEYAETHTELDYNNVEILNVELCPNCDINIIYSEDDIRSEQGED